MLVAPALAKLANARLDNRKLSGTKALLNSIGNKSNTCYPAFSRFWFYFIFVLLGNGAIGFSAASCQ